MLSTEYVWRQTLVPAFSLKSEVMRWMFHFRPESLELRSGLDGISSCSVSNFKKIPPDYTSPDTSTQSTNYQNDDIWLGTNLAYSTEKLKSILIARHFFWVWSVKWLRDPNYQNNNNWLFDKSNVLKNSNIYSFSRHFVWVWSVKRLRDPPGRLRRLAGPPLHALLIQHYGEPQERGGGKGSREEWLPHQG